jgi:hypothetical protein
MKVSLVIALACCASLGLVGMGGKVVGGPPELDTSVPADGALAAAPLPMPAATPRIPVALPAAPALLAPAPAVEPVLAPTEPLRVSTAEAERIARRYFHAQVEVEELKRALPPDEKAHPRTPKAFPAYFAAIAACEMARMPFASLPPPSAEESLPAVDLIAEGSDFERVYRGWSREDLLVEHWRISRAAHAESQRVIERRFAEGRYELEAKPVSVGWG